MTPLFEALSRRFLSPPAILPRARQRFETGADEPAPAEEIAAPPAAGPVWLMPGVLMRRPNRVRTNPSRLALRTVSSM